MLVSTLTRRLHQNQVFGLTVPLIAKADGAEFGETGRRRSLVDPKKPARTNSAFWINTADANIYRFLKFFTFMSIEEINALEENKNSGKAPRARCCCSPAGQLVWFTVKKLQAAKRITECLFSGSFSALSVKWHFEQLAQDGVPMVEMERAQT
ncbi:hypothetical protein ACLB1S_16220 [Escherichia coli]